MPLFDVLSSLFSTGVVNDLVVAPAFAANNSSNIGVNMKQSEGSRKKQSSSRKKGKTPSPVVPKEKYGTKSSPRAKKTASKKASPQKASRKKSASGTAAASPQGKNRGFFGSLFSRLTPSKKAKSNSAKKSSPQQNRSFFGSLMDRITPTKQGKSTSAKGAKGSTEQKRSIFGGLFDRRTPGKQKYQTTSPGKGKKGSNEKSWFDSLKAKLSPAKKGKSTKKGKSQPSWWDSLKKNEKMKKLSAFKDKTVRATKSLVGSEDFRKAAISAGATILGTPDELINMGGSLLTGNYVGAAASAGRLLKKAFAPVAGVAAEHFVGEFGGSERMKKMVGAGVEAGVGVLEGENPLIAAGSTAAGVLAEHVAKKRGASDEAAAAYRGFTAAMASTGANKIEEALTKQTRNSEKTLSEGREQLKKIMSLMSTGMSETAAKAVVSAGMSGGTAAAVENADKPKKRGKKN